MKVEIRECGNVSELMNWRMEVIREVFSVPVETAIDGLERANREYYLRHLANGSHVACLAYVDGESVGCGGLCLHDEMPSPDNPKGHCGYLMNIFVTKEFRGRGIGREIVRWLIGKAIERGASKVYLETTDAARRLYSGVGFKPMKDMMKLHDKH